MEQKVFERTETIEYVDGFKIIHSRPILTVKEKKEIDTKILTNLHNYFYNRI